MARLTIVLLVSLAFAFSSKAYALEVPKLSARVNDYAGLLDGGEAAALESKLAAYEQATGHQFALLTVATLDGDPIEDFSIRAVEAWKLGVQGRDDGLLLIVVPNDRKMRIEVGYGLEGEITDAFSAGVIREVLTPAFRAERYAEGILRAFELLMAKGQGIAVGPQTERPRGGGRSPLPGIVFFFVILMVLSRFGGGGGGGRRRRRGGMIFIPGGLGGGGGFGGGGGGGFGGGGGGFGGGGASGSW